ncbi:MAG: N-6 DNA methylase [Pedobacter sp.]|uniref:N-6 DNA methylase n=1 Tax=Pedobacter sp. TaxID=1411316 RepID=UPI003568A55C
MSEIQQDILAVLSTLEIDGNNVRITEQLDRKLYLAVNQVLERIGGKWNKKVKAHVFSIDPVSRLEAVINSGQFDPKIKTGYFPTPEKIVRQMIELLDIQPGNSVVEPSAGQGHILDLLPNNINYSIKIGEILAENRGLLNLKKYTVDFVDFLTEQAEYDRIIQNPPFERQQDVDHVNHAINCLNPDGILVSVMSAGVLFRNNKKTQQFRDDVLNYAEVIKLPEGSFKESGTMVNAIIIKYTK